MNDMRYIRNVATLKMDDAACTGCGLCVTVCPHRIFTLEARKAAIRDRDLCMECGACMVNCPARALTVNQGVGCATAVINGWVKGGEPTCGCGGPDGPACCG